MKLSNTATHSDHQPEGCVLLILNVFLTPLHWPDFFVKDL